MNEREQLAKDNGMTIEFVNWFFDNKKDGCGNVWFMMMAAMWEGWQAASKASEQQLSESRREFTAANATIHNLELQLAQVVAENAGLKAGVQDRIEVINRGGQAYCVKDGMSVNPIYARGWNDCRAKSLSVETPATDAYLAEVRAQQHAETLNDLVRHIDKNIDIGSLKTPWELSSEIVDYVNQQLHSEFAAQLRQGAKS